MGVASTLATLGKFLGLPPPRFRRRVEGFFALLTDASSLLIDRDELTLTDGTDRMDAQD
jgi:hypothetical protein